MITEPEIVTAPISEFCRRSGLGLTKTYELINNGKLRSIRIGRRRLIVMASYHELIAEHLGTAAEKPAANPPRPKRGRRAAAA